MNIDVLTLITFCQSCMAYSINLSSSFLSVVILSILISSLILYMFAGIAKVHKWMFVPLPCAKGFTAICKCIGPWRDGQTDRQTDRQIGLLFLTIMTFPSLSLLLRAWRRLYSVRRWGPCGHVAAVLRTWPPRRLGPAIALRVIFRCVHASL